MVEMREHGQREHWRDRGKVEVRLTARQCALVGQLVWGRDRAMFTTNENEALDGWPQVVVGRAT
jgi:hypothetical protein